MEEDLNIISLSFSHNDILRISVLHAKATGLQAKRSRLHRELLMRRTNLSALDC